MPLKKLSATERIQLSVYLDIREDCESHRDYDAGRYLSKHFLFKGLLGKLCAKGMTVQRLEDIPSSTLFNPSKIKFESIYYAQRFETGNMLRNDLANKNENVGINSCYFSIDKLVSDEYSGKFGGKFKEGAAILSELSTFMLNPNERNAYETYNATSGCVKLAALTAGVVGSIAGCTEVGGYYDLFLNTALGFMMGITGGIIFGPPIAARIADSDFMAKRGVVTQTKLNLEKMRKTRRERYEKLCETAIQQNQKLKR